MIPCAVTVAAPIYYEIGLFLEFENSLPGFLTSIFLVSLTQPMYYFGLYFFSKSLWQLGALINDSDFEVKVSDYDISIIQVNTKNKNKRCEEELDETTKTRH